ncbi:MAG TPA: AGE family epimerase/isomerase [Clostridiaceae bacterium]
MDINYIEKLKEDATTELKDNILAFWMNNTLDLENGGIYGKLTNSNKIDKKAPKGCILNSRVLWTFSNAYRTFKDEKYLKVAKITYDYLIKYFYDEEFKGLYWMVDYKGNPIDVKKQMYNLSFGIYGLTEYYRATGVKEALDKAIEIYQVIEKYSYDEKNKGYIEALERDWSKISDSRLSYKEPNCSKTMNTHLHILESYTNLYRVWKDDSFKLKFKELIEVIMDHIIDHNTYQFKLFFNDDWNSLEDVISFGHDIEGSWLLYEAALILGDSEVIEKAKIFSIKMAEKVYADGIDREKGGLYNEIKDGKLDSHKAWWPQAETLVGFINAFELTGDEKFLKETYKMWDYIQRVFVNKEFGEWYSVVSLEGKVIEEVPKVEPWKCPYHNGRCCFEIIERLNKIK